MLSASCARAVPGRGLIANELDQPERSGDVTTTRDTISLDKQTEQQLINGTGLDGRGNDSRRCRRAAALVAQPYRHLRQVEGVDGLGTGQAEAPCQGDRRGVVRRRGPVVLGASVGIAAEVCEHPSVPKGERLDLEVAGACARVGGRLRMLLGGVKVVRQDRDEGETRWASAAVDVLSLGQRQRVDSELTRRMQVAVLGLPMCKPGEDQRERAVLTIASEFEGLFERSA